MPPAAEAKSAICESRMETSTFCDDRVLETVSGSAALASVGVATSCCRYAMASLPRSDVMSGFSKMAARISPTEDTWVDERD